MSNRAVELKAQFGALVKEMESLAAKPELSEDERKSYDAKLAQAQSLKSEIEQGQALEALKAWQDAPDGQSVVKASYGAERVSTDTFNGWSGETIVSDGNIPDVMAKAWKPKFDVRGQVVGIEGGELEPMNERGAAKLKALQSGAYKDALRAYIRASARGTGIEAKHMKVLQEGVDTAGGNFVLPDMRTEIIQKQATVMGVANNVYSFQAGSSMVSFGRVNYSADDKFTTGVRLAWTAEGPTNDISESTNPAASRVNIPVHTATAAVIVTREMLEDAYFDILGFVSGKIGEAFGLGMNDVFISGDGSGKPQGILSHTNASVAHSSGGMQVLSGASGVVAWGNATTGILGTEAALPPQYESGAKWYANKSTFAAVRAINAGTATLPQWSTGDSYPNFANGYQPTLLGYPVVKDQFVPDVGASNRPLIFGDLKGYYAPMRSGITIEVLREIRALRGEVVIYARQRVGGQLAEDYRVKVLKSNNS